MNVQNEKCVIVIDESLPIGIIANTAAIMGISLGKNMPHVVGSDVQDLDGYRHPGIIELPVPILKSSSEKIKELREKLYQEDYSELTVIDFSDLAQSYKMSQSHESSLEYFGIAICGSKKKINRLTGSMPLLR